MGMTDDEKQTEIRRLIYEERMKLKDKSLELQGDYGKWLLGSLVLVHAGAFAFLARGNDLAFTIFKETYGWFFAGLILALLSGYVTWVNWSLNWDYYDDTNPSMIHDPNGRPFEDPVKYRRIFVSYWLSVILGFLSASCLIGVAFNVAFII